MHPILEYQGEQADPGESLAFLSLVLLSALKKTKDDYDKFKIQTQNDLTDLRKRIADLEGTMKVIEAKELG